MKRQLEEACSRGKWQSGIFVNFFFYLRDVARIKLGVVVRKSRLHPLELRLVGGTSSISKLKRI